MKVIKVLLIAGGALFAIVIFAIIAAGILIPAERSFTNTVEINKPAVKVWQVITDKGKFAEWQTNLERVEVTDDKNWVEYPKDSPAPLKFTVANDNRPNGMAFDYTMGDKFEGTWHGHATPTATGVHLETVDSYVAKGWMTKILIYLFFDFDKFAKDWNSKLKQRVETQN